MKQKIIIGNWKNYLGHKESISLAHSLSELVTKDKTRVMVSPNHLYLNEVNQRYGAKEFLVLGKTIFSEILSLIHFFIRFSSSGGDEKNIFLGKLVLLE